VEKKYVTLANKWGLHARTAFALARASGGFEAAVSFEKDGLVADGKRIDELLMLTAACGDRLAVVIDGPDEKQAMERLVGLIESKFGEKE